MPSRSVDQQCRSQRRGRERPTKLMPEQDLLIDCESPAGRRVGAEYPLHGRSQPLWSRPEPYWCPPRRRPHRRGQRRLRQRRTGQLPAARPAPRRNAEQQMSALPRFGPRPRAAFALSNKDRRASRLPPHRRARPKPSPSVRDSARGRAASSGQPGRLECGGEASPRRTYPMGSIPGARGTAGAFPQTMLRGDLGAGDPAGASLEDLPDSGMGACIPLASQDAIAAGLAAMRLT